MRELYTVHFSCGHKKNDWGNENIFDSNNWPQTPLILTTNILGNNYKHVFRILSDDRSCRAARW